MNTYPIFAELNRSIVVLNGRVGCILPSGIATDDTTKAFFQDIVERGSLLSFYDFENSKPLFEGVHRSFKLCLLTLTGLGAPSTHGAAFLFFGRDVTDITDADRCFTLTAADIRLLNPNTMTCPIFRGRKDADLTKHVYFGLPIIESESSHNDWHPMIRRVLNETDDSSHFRTHDVMTSSGFVLDAYGNFSDGVRDYVRLLEAKMFWQYDHRYATYPKSDEGDCEPCSDSQHHDPLFAAVPRHWFPTDILTEFFDEKEVPRWFLSYRRITNVTNERTIVVTFLPSSALGNLNPTITLDAAPTVWLCFAGEKSAFVFDYIARQKISGTDVNIFKLKQLVSLPPRAYELTARWATENIRSFIADRVLELTYTAWDLEPFARDCGYAGPPFRWDEERRFRLRAELDAAFFHLYLPADTHGDWLPARASSGHAETPEDLARLKASFPTPRHAVDYILDTFPIVRRKDEEKYNGDYRTKRVILEIYDAMQDSIRTGHPYQTRLNPPPGPPADGLPDWLPGTSRPANWPLHIHPPKENLQ